MVKPEPDPSVLLEQYRAMRGALRAAYEDGDHAAFLAAVMDRCLIDEAGCWIWQGRLKGGYPQVVMGGKHLFMHRAVLRAKHAADLGTQSAHHICAVRSCCNPDHLQPVTHSENIAEMLARRSYVTRIQELEAALAAINPDHPLLNVIAVA